MDDFSVVESTDAFSADQAASIYSQLDSMPSNEGGRGRGEGRHWRVPIETILANPVEEGINK